ncbi:hypothetical protein DJ030_10905 [bacterium endosymbiont of Escarpia laminata]|nr:MAG: hypothetical protein DJ030_10905 [bacterium endosymbiont of Escarpia laminata]
MVPVLPLDIVSIEDSRQTPAWHRHVLADRASAIERGEDTFDDWETAKKNILLDIRQDDTVRTSQS